MNEQTKEIVLQTGGDYLVPAAALDQILATYQLKKDFIAKVLKEGVDYGVTPGTNDKPSLKKAGAEKMATFFGLTPTFESVETVEDWIGIDHDDEPFFYYWQKCTLRRGDRVTRFEIAEPSLEEVFVEHVGRRATSEEESHLAARSEAGP